ncbi:uncharacterized protein A4U43_C04F31780 [Asparagus officinalis]|uniref:non-specific serine/threonine protein kinase n=2 Tax=Asparagus officinalis TaxID=4686 RepID=A0A5P1F6T8_ASPOF|nr:uncharacterized protein A4U43_C04F31780 [Asparagus officinalis]
MYARKRKLRPVEAGLVGPSAKRRLIWSSERDVEEVTSDDQFGNHSCSMTVTRVHANIADTSANSLSAVVASNLSTGLASTPSILRDNIFCPISETKNVNHSRGGEIGNWDNVHEMTLGQESQDDSLPIFVQKELCDNTQVMTVQQKFLELFGYDDDDPLDFVPSAAYVDTDGRLQIHEPGSLLDKPTDVPLLWMETLGEDSCIVSASPSAFRYEVNPVSSKFQGANNDINGPSIEIGSLAGQVARRDEHTVATEVNYCGTGGILFQMDASMREEKKSALEVHYTPELECRAESLLAEPGTNLEQQRLLSEKPISKEGVSLMIGCQRPNQKSCIRRNGSSPKCEQDKRTEKGALTKEKMRRSCPINASSKENRQDTTKISKTGSESKLLPNFDSFVIEEEEGSGGYGTVYRARRKEDGKIFAVKCPHPNAHSHHVHNELKMLERFGGRNFVIQYEGSFKSGQSECFVLEHVEHDRPEVLKKEIDIFELQWYGYCMFRALTSLHKQGIVHRDVKPGNFLFSRKLSKGYLIDFNLASDLHQKYSKGSRSENTSSKNCDPLSLSTPKSTLHDQTGNSIKSRVLSNIPKEVDKDSRKVSLKNMKKESSKREIETFHRIDSSSKYGSQAADSGVTSTKDPTSTRTHSADRLKHPIIPYKGRKELLNFVQEAMQSPSHKKATGPSSQRKRVAAPLGKMNSKLMILTPMPLHSGGNAVAGAGMFNRGNGKHKREGPCVGTKGFRAPEVLFKSCHQSCKVDVWSAGVTLLYLIIGKIPFGGDPEQNIKEIAKLRGSEDLWEVAKLHNCESSFPTDLLDVRFLKTTELRDWCAMNTKRTDFLEQVPQSLFDLIDRCLTVNPRRRITAEEALMHSFFTPCHESLRKQRLLRRTNGSEPGS